MNDHELDRLVARANPFGDESVRQIPTGGAESDLLEEIVKTRRFNLRLMVAAAAAVAIVALGGIFLPGGGRGPAAPPRAYAAELVAVAEANQRLLLDAPGWNISDVPEFTVKTGEMRFTNGQAYLDVHWRPGDQFGRYSEDRAAIGAPKQIEFLGQTGKMYNYDGSQRYTTMLPPKGPNFLEIDGKVGSEQAYRELISKLRPVDVNTWLDAMPESVVKPADAEKVIKEMLADVPLPAGFDTGRLNDQATRDRYQLGARVTASVTCAWVDQWVKGDAKQRDQAVTALKTARSWKILQEMNEDGDMPEVIWEIAASVISGKTPPYYKEGLGCD